MASALSTKWDGLFSRYADRLPVAYMRALTKRESDMNPLDATDPAWGLMQVVPQVRESYNQRKGTRYTQGDLLDPETNVKIAADLLNRIVVAYQKHPDRNMKEDWGNPEFVKLVTAGWNSGYSEAGGVGKVASYLERQGKPVTHDAVFQTAAAAGATVHLQNPVKYSWQRSVSDLYFAQPDRGRGGGTSNVFVMGALAIAFGLAVAHFWRNR